MTKEPNKMKRNDYFHYLLHLLVCNIRADCETPMINFSEEMVKKDSLSRENLIRVSGMVLSGEYILTPLLSYIDQ